MADPESPLSHALITLFDHLLEPWTRNPKMLSVCLHAGLLPGAQSIAEHGRDVVRPYFESVFAGHDPELVEDIRIILTALFDGLMTWFATGRTDPTEIRRVFRRALVRLTTGARRDDRDR